MRATWLWSRPRIPLTCRQKPQEQQCILDADPQGHPRSSVFGVHGVHAHLLCLPAFLWVPLYVCPLLFSLFLFFYLSPSFSLSLFLSSCPRSPSALPPVFYLTLLPALSFSFSLSLYLLPQSQSLFLFFLSCHSHPWSPLTAPQEGLTAEPSRPREPRRAMMQLVAELGPFSVYLILTLLILTSPRHTLQSPASGLCRRAPPSTAEARNPLSAHARHIPRSLPSPDDPKGLSWPGVNASRSDPGGPNTTWGAESWARPGTDSPTFPTLVPELQVPSFLFFFN